MRVQVSRRSELAAMAGRRTSWLKLRTVTAQAELKATTQSQSLASQQAEQQLDECEDDEMRLSNRTKDQDQDGGRKACK